MSHEHRPSSPPEGHLASKKMLTTYFDRGEIDTSAYADRPIDFFLLQT